jgi:predicted amidophosphoribosyltransferase
VLLVPTCIVCATPGAALCAPCTDELHRAPALPPPLGLEGWTALLRYDDAARVVLTGLKNRQRRDLVAWVADGLVGVLPVAPAPVVTWAPTGAPRRHARGFDQAELVARALARRWRVPCRPLLRRLAGPAQAGLAGADRRKNPRFRAVGSAPAAVAVVDDVATTGATLTAAARALGGAGALRVHGVVVARTGWGGGD